VRPHGVVVPAPAFDDDPGFGEGEKDFAVEEFATQSRIEAFDEAILPRAAWRDIGGPGADRGNPFPDGSGDELGSIVRANMLRRATQDEQVGQDIDDIGGVQLAIDSDRQRLVRELVDHVQHAILPSVMGSILDEVVGPDVVGPLGAKTDARSVVEP